MNSWNNGYITDSMYTSGYYYEISPQMIRFNLLMKGITLPADKDINYLELGFGQGLSLAIHAAATSCHCEGTDFNPSHALEAQSLAQKAGAHTTAYDDSFAQLAARDDLPAFDIITLHGIWSWVSDENREHIVEIIRKNLKLGGVVYLGYNVLPGWANFSPVRELMKLYTNSVEQPTARIHENIPKAIEFIDSLANTTHYLRGNPSIAQHMSKIKNMSLDYLGHEYFNADWKAYYFYQMASDMNKAKLTYTTAANSMANVDPIHIPQDILSSFYTYDLPLRETLRDFVLNQTFRKDLFTKGARNLNKLELKNTLSNFYFLQTKPAAELSLTINTSLGELTLKDTLYKAFMEELEKHKGYAQLKDICQHPALSGENLSTIIEVLNILVGTNAIMPALSPEEQKHNKEKCRKLNIYLMESALAKFQHAFLASPVTGAGVHSNRFEMLILLAIEQGKTDKKLIPLHIYNQLEQVGEYLQENNERLPKEKALETLENIINEFFEKRLPVFKAFKIVS